ncbi:hypothetical protein [Amorphus coralli]|uniref:hypothetical protein n=1 Tax=Amorphus coralli TaxID=340680 RepID=UPI000377B617|nr:hypothetical protein [Amorphus coralli]
MGPELDFSNFASAGSSIAAMADKLDLSTAETSRALTALMPAFAVAYQRAAADPERLKEAIQEAMPVGRFDDDSERLSKAFFGQDDLARAVIDQAARSSGLGADIVRTLFPAVAADFATSLTRSNRFGTAGDLMIAFFRGYARGRSGDRSAPSTFNPWLDAMSAFTDGFMRSQGDEGPTVATNTAAMVDSANNAAAAMGFPDVQAYQRLFDQFSAFGKTGKS